MGRAVKRVYNEPSPSVWLNAFDRNSTEFEVQYWIDELEEGVGNVSSEVLVSPGHRRWSGTTTERLAPAKRRRHLPFRLTSIPA